MNTQEFKAWFAGYTEGKESLTAEQLARVKEEIDRLSLLVDVPTYPHPSLPGYWPPAVITKTPTTISDGIIWSACDPVRLTCAARP